MYPQGQAQTGNLGKRNHYSLPPSKLGPKGKEERKELGCVSVEGGGHSQRRVINQDRTFQAPHLLLCEDLTFILPSPRESPTTLGIQALVGTPTVTQTDRTWPIEPKSHGAIREGEQ